MSIECRSFDGAIKSQSTAHAMANWARGSHAQAGFRLALRTPRSISIQSADFAVAVFLFAVASTVSRPPAGHQCDTASRTATPHVAVGPVDAVLGCWPRFTVA